MEKILNKILLQDTKNKIGFELIVMNSGVEVDIHTTKNSIIGIKTTCGILHHKGIKFHSLSKKINSMLDNN
ncbi:MAG: hypothetical protein ACRC92_27590 [Peptostreptococcaceae bacterium]